MKASYTVDAGDVRVIRPFLYTREKLLRDFSYGAGERRARRAVDASGVQSAQSDFAHAHCARVHRTLAARGINILAEN
eukprot:125280-Pyramimonas_sp.AAC.2